MLAFKKKGWPFYSAMETLLPNDFARGSRAYNPAAATTTGNAGIVQAPPPPAGLQAAAITTTGNVGMQAPPSAASDYAGMSDCGSTPAPPNSSVPSNSIATSDNRYVLVA